MKKVSVNKWKKLLPKNAPVEVKANVSFPETDEVLEIVVNPTLSIEDRMSFAKDIVGACFDVNDGTYIPYAFDIAFAINLVQYFTNIDLGKDSVLAFELTENSNLIQVIKSTVGEQLMDCIETEVYELLQWEKSRRMRSTKADELYDAIIGLIDKFSDMADSARDNLDEDKITDLANVLKTFGDQDQLARAIVRARKEQK